MVCIAFLSFPPSILLRRYRLVAKDRHEEARKVICQYHTNGEDDHPLVALQMKEMSDSLKDESLMWREFFDLRILFNSRSRRYRMMLNMTFSWFGQFSGNK